MLSIKNIAKVTSILTIGTIISAIGNLIYNIQILLILIMRFIPNIH